MAKTSHIVDFSASLLLRFVVFLMSNNIYVQENSLKKVYLKETNLTRMGLVVLPEFLHKWSKSAV